MSAKQPQSRSWWRPVAAGACVVIASLALIGSILTRYVQRTIVDTNGYLAVVGPLPENPKVSGALAQFTTQKIFDRASAENEIRDALPPRLAPLAGPLAGVLERSARGVAQKFIQSDAFSAIWTTSNRLLQKGVVRLAQSKQAQPRQTAGGRLDLSQLSSAVRERLDGQQVSALSPEQQDRAAGIQINLRQRVDRLRTAYRIVTNGAYALPYVSVAFVLAAVAIGYDRRRTIRAIGGTLLLLGVVLLVAFKIVSGGMLGEMTNQTYRAAAEAVYQAFYNPLRGQLVGTAVLGGVLIVLAVLAGPYAWARRLRTALGFDALKNLSVHRAIASGRRRIAQYQLWFVLAGAAATVIWLLALHSLSLATLVVILSIFIAYLSLLHLLARPSPSRASG